jgi:hypothetical protein
MFEKSADFLAAHGMVAGTLYRAIHGRVWPVTEAGSRPMRVAKRVTRARLIRRLLAGVRTNYPAAMPAAATQWIAPDGIARAGAAILAVRLALAQCAPGRYRPCHHTSSLASRTCARVLRFRCSFVPMLRRRYAPLRRA